MTATSPHASSPREDLAARLARQWPDLPAPVAMARVEAVPDGIPLWTGPATSACQFWREARNRVFAAGAEHGTCAVGRVTQGFTTELPTGDQLIGTMVETEYVDPAEIASMPALPLGHEAIVYGPLADFPLEPEAVLVIAPPNALMVMAEALGAARLDRPALPVMGRPTCAAVSAAVLRDGPHGSLACVGARLFAGFDPGEMLLALPASALDRLDSGLERALVSNDRVGALGIALKEQVAAAG